MGLTFTLLRFAEVHDWLLVRLLRWLFYEECSTGRRCAGSKSKYWYLMYVGSWIDGGKRCWLEG